MDNHNCLIIKVRATDYVLGSNSPILFAENCSDWAQHLDWFERQKFAWETNGCVLFTAQESFDAQMDHLILSGKFPQNILDQFAAMGYMDVSSVDNKPHFHSSARFLQIMTGNGYNGNSVQDAWDAIRKYGAVPWADLPFTADLTSQTYLAPVSAQTLQKGKSLLNLIGGKNAVQYHWVANNSPKNVPSMKTVLLQAPLCLGIAVATDWNEITPTPDPSPTDSPEHAVMGYEIEVPEVKILDHYIPFEKLLDAGYPINYVLQGIVNPLAPITVPAVVPIAPNVASTQANLSILQKLVPLYQKLVQLFQQTLQGIFHD
jgi:hypothetical protein